MNVRRVVVVGTGLIGTSVGLALTEAGIAVHLLDSDAERVSVAADLGAGRAYAGGPAADVAVVCVPPGAVPAAVVRAQRDGLARFVTDVASVKASVLAACRDSGADATTLVGGHPVAGRERSGPVLARSDLFAGRPWVLTPLPETDSDALEAVRSLVEACAAVPVLLDPAVHDGALALTSHAPQLVASALAALLEDAPAQLVSLAGQGLRDVVRIAASDPELWTGIAVSNAAQLADVLDRLTERLGETAKALRDGDEHTVRQLLRAGNAGYARLPGKHSRPAAAYDVVPVLVSDTPGQLARLFAEAGAAEVNIEDVRVEHSPGAPMGVVELAIRPDRSAALIEALREKGWSVLS